MSSKLNVKNLLTHLLLQGPPVALILSAFMMLR